jgi:hypothetical protein
VLVKTLEDFEVGDLILIDWDLEPRPDDFIVVSDGLFVRLLSGEVFAPDRVLGVVIERRRILIAEYRDQPSRFENIDTDVYNSLSLVRWEVHGSDGDPKDVALAKERLQPPSLHFSREVSRVLFARVFWWSWLTFASWGWF